jgi:antitoxin component YwqK of YwqJK toxin-antitoxin module
MKFYIKSVSKSHHIVLLYFLLYTCLGYSQDLFPAYPKEITYKDGVVYLNGNRFTGLLVQKKTNKSIGEFQNGFRVGYFLDYFDNGNKKYEGTFDYEIVQGVYKEWHANGNLKFVIEYTDGKYNGSYNEYNENGIKRYEGNYVNGLREGIHTSYYTNGQNNLVISWSRDKILGEYIMYFENGHKQIEYTKDLLGINGQYSEWFDNGNLKVLYEYENDKIVDGKYTVHAISGDKEKIEWYRGGVKVKESLYKDGILFDSITEYFPNSKQVKSRGLKKDGLEDGLWSSWFENGPKKSGSTTTAPTSTIH